MTKTKYAKIKIETKKAEGTIETDNLKTGNAIKKEFKGVLRAKK